MDILVSELIPTSFSAPRGAVARRSCQLTRYSLALLLLLPLAGCGSPDETLPSGKGERPDTQTVTVPATQLPAAELTQAQSGDAGETGPAEPPVNDEVPSAAPTEESAPSLQQDAQLGAQQLAVSTPAAQRTEPEYLPAVELTSEQKDKWSRAPFEPVQLLRCLDSDASPFATEMVALPDGHHFLLVGHKLALWSLTGDQPDAVFCDLTGSPNDLSITALAIAPDGQWAASGDSDGWLRIWSIDDAKELTAKQIYQDDVVQIAISPDGRELATISHGSQVVVWAARSLEPKKRFEVEGNGLRRIAYLSAGKLVAAADTTTLWNTETGELQQTLSKGRYKYTLARAPQGHWFAFGFGDNLQLWDIEKESAAATLPRFASNELLAFSSDAKYLAAANQLEIRIWDLATRQVVQVIDSCGWSTVALQWLPETQLLLIATEDGLVRTWGTMAAGERFGLSPLQPPMAMPESDSHVPMNPAQLLQTIDLRSFPLLPDCAPQALDASTVFYTAPVSDADSRLFYRYFLGQNGWKEVRSAVASPDMLEFVKNGSALSASVTKSGDSETSISVTHAGNYDLRWVPRIDVAPIETVYEGPQTVIYRTKAELVDLETNLLRRLHESGWTAFAQLNSSHSESPDSRDLQFLQNGMILRVTIGKAPTDPTSYSIQYSRFLTTNSLPVPSDCGFIEFDGSTRPLLVAQTTMDLAQARAFYQQQMVAQGWLMRSRGQSEKEDQCWLPFFQGQKSIVIGLLRLPDGRTLIRAGDDLERSSWQLEKPKTQPESTGPSARLEAADFPLLNESPPITYHPDDKSLEVEVRATSLSDVVGQYTQRLAELGWKVEEGGVRSDDYVYITFEQDDAEIEFRARLTDGKASLNIQGDGIVWTKPLPGGPAIVSYETWLRRGHHPASLDTLDEYTAEMKALQQAGGTVEEQ